MTATAAETEWRPSSREELAARTTHRVTGYDGNYEIRFLDLEQLIANDAVPETLLGIALREVLGDEEEARKMADQVRAGDISEATRLVKDLIALQRWLTVESIVEPLIDLHDVEAGLVSARDLELLRQIAMRERNTDARGVFLGVVPLDLFTTFREVHELIGGDDWRDGHPAGLVEGCPACQAFEGALSTARGA